MTISSELLIMAGALFLLRSLIYLRILLQDEQTRNLTGWRLLLGFVIIFLFGYLGYGWHLLSHRPEFADLIVSLVFCSGGLFVLITMHASVQTLRRVREIMQRERHSWLHDSLTNLPNRRLALDRIEQAIRLGQPAKRPIAIMMMDLNRFKDINDTLGHHFGDELLTALAQRLLRVVTLTCMAARMGGDEFCFVLESSEKKEAILFCKNILALIDEPFIIDGHKISVDGSIGIAMYPEHGKLAQQLLQHADVAMYAAKRNGDSYVMYAEELNQSSLAKLTLIAMLKHPDFANQLSMHYQPKINLGTGAVCGLEALVRWKHPSLGDIPPDQFIAVAECTDSIKQITFTVLHKVLAQLEAWHAAGWDLRVAINLSMRSLSDENLPNDIAQALASYHIPPSSLILEITESSIMLNPSLANASLTTLSALGIQCSIDDFGTGYSSLAYLKNLPAKEIKIDKSFVTDMTTNENDAIIVHATIVMAHNMGYRVVAEGVESAETLELLHILGCDVAQGFYFSKPMPAYAVPDWIAWHNKQSQCYASLLLSAPKEVKLVATPVRAISATH
ncbi:MAG: putative bifunctional diguanylate cyclase/phosphodiesterase [Sulfuriferula sp.]